MGEIQNKSSRKRFVLKETNSTIALTSDSDTPHAATYIIPQTEQAERAVRRASAKSKAPAKTTEQSYEAAADQCRRKVAQIVSECRRVNQRYRDPHFDLEFDLRLNHRNCLDSLDNVHDDGCHFGSGRYARSSRRRQLPKKDREEDENVKGTVVLSLLDKVDQERVPIKKDGEGNSVMTPRAVKRVVDIFDAPEFFIDGPTANDVRQGRDGDCWLMAALCTLSNKPGLIERCCVAHDQAVGVYGFVFHRDGEWFSEIIDDKVSPSLSPGISCRHVNATPLRADRCISSYILRSPTMRIIIPMSGCRGTPWIV